MLARSGYRKLSWIGSDDVAGGTELAYRARDLN